MELDEELVNSQIDTQVSFKPDGAVDSAGDCKVKRETDEAEQSVEELRAGYVMATVDADEAIDSSSSSSSEDDGDDKEPTPSRPEKAAKELHLEKTEENAASQELTATSSTMPKSTAASYLASTSIIDCDAMCRSDLAPTLRSFTPETCMEGKEEDYYDFTFWRMPLPEVDLDLDAVKDHSSGKSPACMTITPVEVQHDTDVPTQERDSGIKVHPFDTLLDGVHLLELRTDEEAGSDTALNKGAESVVDDVDETVANIGSTHVLGQHLKESTLTVVNGVVQGRGKHTSHISACRPGCVAWALPSWSACMVTVC